MYTRLEEQALTNVGRIAQALSVISETLVRLDDKLGKIVSHYDTLEKIAEYDESNKETLKF